jgi:antitoxin (DNA-binding transcriptional repressor) of toxin-antitoxin stability system
MKTIALSDKTPLDELMRQAEKEDVLLTRDGHAVALLMPFDDEDVEWYTREHDTAFLESIAKARQQVANRKTKSHGDLKKELGME